MDPNLILTTAWLLAFQVKFSSQLIGRTVTNEEIPIINTSPPDPESGKSEATLYHPSRLERGSGTTKKVRQEAVKVGTGTEVGAQVGTVTVTQFGGSGELTNEEDKRC